MDEIDKFVYKVLGSIALLFAVIYIAYIKTSNPYVFLIGILTTFPLSRLLARDLRKYDRKTREYLRDFTVANISFYFGIMMGLFFGKML